MDKGKPIISCCPEFTENMKDTIMSLQKLLQLDFDTVFCAQSIVANGKATLQEKLEKPVIS